MNIPNVFIFNKISNNRQDVKILRQTFESLNCTVTEIFNQNYEELKDLSGEKNNCKDLERLRQTFESLDCIVTEIQNGTLEEIKAQRDAIVRANFSKFKYVVIIILDNTNADEGIWITTDGKSFHINGDLLTRLYANETLQGKLRFTILQTNRDTQTELRTIPKRSCQKCFAAFDLKYCATSPGGYLKHKWTRNEPSPFIDTLCSQIIENISSPNPKPILEMLDCISNRVTDLTNEVPTKEKNFSKSIVLGRAM